MEFATRTVTERMQARLGEFLRLESAGGLLLMGAAALAMIVANSPLAVYYDLLLDLSVEVRVGTFEIDKPLLLWINDGLMAVFFFLIGLELKRELLEGHLSSLRSASLPSFAAVGGMAVPAAIYAAFNWGDPVAMEGWAIPAATDIAFALGVLLLLGDRVPTALKAFLLSLAIFDDIGAIVVIALFYTADLSMLALIVSAILLVGLTWLNRSGVRSPGPYFILGIPLWIAVLKSGVHATLAGVALAMFIPLLVRERSDTSDPAKPPLLRLERSLHPWVAFGVLPIFAFANAGVPILELSMSDLIHPVPLGIVGGLVVGKVVGIVAMSGLAVALAGASLPAGSRWSHLVGTSLLAGIGFTMSLLIASLAFQHGAEAYLGLERIGILTASLIAGLSGYLVLRATLKRS